MSNAACVQIVEFIMGKRHIVESLALCNSEGFWGDDNEYLSLANKHNFNASHLGFVLGALKDKLRVRALCRPARISRW